MKRANTERGFNPKRSAWQQPASCEFCRLKKIRCDKNHPCHNCISRDIRCRYAISSRSDEDDGCDFPSLSDSLKSLGQHMAEINLRLQRLESFLIPNIEDVPQIQAHPTAISAQCYASHDTEERQSVETWDTLEAIAAATEEHNSNNSVQQPLSSTSEHENLSILQDQTNRILPPHNIPTYDVSYKTEQKPRETVDLIEKLPGIQLAQVLFDYYARTIHHFHHEIDIRVSRSLLEATYSNLLQPVNVVKDNLALLFSVFASSSFYMIRNESHVHSRELADVRVSYKSWRDIALGLVMSRDTMLSPTLISLQSVCVMFDLLWDSEGQSPAFNVLRGVATTKAIQMGLHILDSNRAESGDTIEIETKRCIWWHLASTDWIVGSLPGPYHGIHAIHPRHMSVKCPTDIIPKNPNSPSQAEQLDRPTPMSFFIQRTKFAKICREVMDSLRSPGPMRCKSEYQSLLQLSKKFESFSNQLPWYFRFHAEKGQGADLLATHYPYIARQRSALLYALYARLGRLHRRYFHRGLHSAEYSFSRKTAVDCAEKLLELEAASEAGGTFSYVYSYSMDQHLFSILLIQVIDITADQDEARAQVRMAEIFKTYKKLEGKQKMLHRSGNGTTRAIQKLIRLLRTDSRFQHTLSDQALYVEHSTREVCFNDGMMTTSTVNSLLKDMESDPRSFVWPSSTYIDTNDQVTCTRKSEGSSSASHFSFEDDLNELWEEFIANMPNSPTHCSHLDCLESHDFPAGGSDPPCLSSRSKCTNYISTDKGV